MDTNGNYSYFSSSIGKKQIMGLAGILMAGFLIVHLIGNFLMFLGPEKFNLYAHTLTSLPIIYAAEVMLVLLFLVHVLLAIGLITENFLARPKRYFVKVRTGRGSTIASSTMAYTGLIILIFLINHLLVLKFGNFYIGYQGETEVRDIYKLVIEIFQSPYYLSGYIVAMLILGLHVSHGIQSAFVTFGIYHPRYTPGVKISSIAFSVIIALLYSAFPIWAYLQERI